MIYEPREDSYLLEEQVKKCSKGKRVLDLGSGSGIQAKAALSSGASSVLASDINKESIKLLKKQGINAIQSNLFDKINGKFDLIGFNPPYLPENKQEDNESKKATTGGKKGDEIILKFIKQSVSHIENKGIILLLISSLTPQDKINKLLEKLKLKKETLSKKSFFMETLEVWKIEQQQNL